MRRSHLLLVAALLGFVACSSDPPEPPPTTVRLAADAALSERAQTVLTDLAAPLGLTVETVAPAEADLIVSNESSAGATPFAVRYWVPAVALSSSLEDVTMDELRAAVLRDQADAPANPSDVRGPQALIPNEQPAPLTQWWPDVTPTTVPTMPIADIVTALDNQAGVLALLPLGSVTAAARTLSVNGTDIVFGEGNIAAYPLVERAWVRAMPHENEEFDRVLDTLALPLAAQLAVPPPDAIILRATGDILPVRCTLAKIQEYGGDFRRPFLELGPWLAEADITVGSLDAAVSDAGVPFGCEETFYLLAPAAAADGFAFAGFDVMTVATNHVKDCGQSACGDQAFFDTLANLRARDIQPVGAGTDLDEARRPAVITVDGVRFAFLGYDEIASYYHAEAGVPGTAPLNETFLREDVAAAAAQADVVVVLPQWGVEYTADPNDNQRALARAAVEAGADLVIGNHPHWVQAAEVIDGVFVAYALGNFVFDQDWSTETQQGVVLEAAFDGSRLVGVRYHPVHIYDEHQPRFAEPEEATQILDRIWTASAALE